MSLRPLQRCLPFTWMLLAMCHGSIAAAAPPHATILPNTTRGHAATLDLDRLDAQWNLTQVGQLMADPVMEPFKEDLKRQFNDKMEQATQRLGLTWEDVQAMAGGEISASVIRHGDGPTVLAVLIDTTGKEDEVTSRLPVIYKRLTDAKATRRDAERIGETELTLFDLPPRPRVANDHRQSAFFLKDNLLAAVADAQIAREMIPRFSGEPKDTLAERPAYQSIFARCRADAGDAEPDLHWFLEPIAYIEAMRAADPENQQAGRGMLDKLKNQGFEAIRGLGGFVNLYADDGRYEMLHRTSIYAPRPYELAMRMMEFPNSDQFVPFDWVPRDVATHATFHLDVPNAFEKFSTLFEELFCEGKAGAFEETLESVRTDPHGPRLDIRNDMVANLDNRITVITDYQLPITITSERTVYAIKTKDEQEMAVAVKKWLAGDRNAEIKQFQGHTIWEISDDAQRVPEIKVQVPNIGGSGTRRPKYVEREDDQRLLSSSAVAVAHGHLLVATHLDILKKVLRPKADRQQLSDDVDFLVVTEELDRLAAEQNCARIFSRTDEEFRPSYELIRAGKLPEAETSLAKFLNSIMGTKKGEVRQPKIDGSKMPEFEAIRRYFGPAGLVVTHEESGWFAVGFMLNKETP